MAHVITLPCVGVKDGECVSACPMDCIHPKPDSAEFAAAKQLYIDPEPCIDCGLCVDVCPVRAIFQDSDVPAEWRDYVETNAAHFRRSPEE